LERDAKMRVMICESERGRWYALGAYQNTQGQMMARKVAEGATRSEVETKAACLGYETILVHQTVNIPADW